MFELTETCLATLRGLIEPYLPNRMRHTLGVEREAAALGAIYLPEAVPELRAAALLHDITKRFTVEEHQAVFKRNNYTPDAWMLASPKVLHAISASYLAKEVFPEYVNEQILSGIRWHTTGRRDMDLFETIIYLSDYIEDTRTFPDCVKLRDYFYSRLKPDMSPDEKRVVLYQTMVTSFDMTIRNLMDEEGLIDADTLGARNDFILRLRSMEVSK